MSLVTGKWIIAMQGAMTGSMRNSVEWQSLLPRAAETGRQYEEQRRKLILDWMWDGLSLVQPIADRYRFGGKWDTMLRERTVESCAAITAVRGKTAAYHASSAIWLITSGAASHAVYAVTLAATIVASEAPWSTDDFFAKMDPPALLAKLIELGK